MGKTLSPSSRIVIGTITTGSDAYIAGENIYRDCQMTFQSGFLFVKVNQHIINLSVLLHFEVCFEQVPKRLILHFIDHTLEISGEEAERFYQWILQYVIDIT